ncbi:MAG: TRAP transporter large permease [Endozoicomonas sp.]
MDWLPVVTLFGLFFLLLGTGLPVAYSIGLSTAACLVTLMPAGPAVSVVSQRMASGLDNFALLAIPFFILAGNIMNTGGIARRLIDFAELLTGRLPGSLTHCNIMANMLFGSISGSAIASAAAVGGFMSPIQKQQGYDPAFCAAANITSCPSGLLIPPSNSLIVFSVASGGTSIGALFLAGYLPGLLMGFSLMLLAGCISVRRGYPSTPRPSRRQVFTITLRAIPSLLLVFIIMGGIVAGIFTATEASAIAVVYTLILAVVFYREVKLQELPGIFLESAVTTSIIMFLVGASMGMSWAMTLADIPFLISDCIEAMSSNPMIILLLINLLLLIVGSFMDITPALLIFTPIFLPLATDLGISPIHFGIMMTFNLCIGICTPPVGTALFVGSSVANVPVQAVIMQILPFYLMLSVVLLMVTFIPSISLFLPGLFGY